MSVALMRRLAANVRRRFGELKGQMRVPPEEQSCAAIARLKEGAPMPKAGDFRGRFREIVSDPINLLIERHPLAGLVVDGHVVLHNGHVVPIEGAYAYYQGFSDILAINRGVHEPVEEYIFQETIKRLGDAPVMIELGAYWAHYSMWLKKTRPAARLFLVEPDAHNLETGRHNLRINGYEAEFIQAFVGAGQFELDRFCDAHTLNKVDILHMDVQGFEGEALAGARDALEMRAFDYIFVSTHSDEIHAQVCRVLSGRGYRIEVEQDCGSQTTAGDGLVFASSPDVAPVVEGLAPLGRVTIAHAQPQSIVRYLAEKAAP